ncbi:MAG: YqjK family protein [Burkholderiales bacterium]
MNPRLAGIRARRELLLARSAVQREALALLVQRARAPLELADQGIRIVRYAREHPGAVLLAVAALAALSPKRAFGWARRAVPFWRGYRRAAEAIGRLTV